MTKTEKTRTLNDLARTAPGVACKLVQTAGIAALPMDVQSRIRERVETFDDFDKDNDPHFEHDFGAFDDHDAGQVFWKIDYYAAGSNFTYGSDDPSDPGKTIRVLTIMLAAEY